MKKVIQSKQKAKAKLENPISKKQKVEDFRDAESSDFEEPTWISTFCSLPGNEYFIEVDEVWIKDDFNLFGLDEVVEDFRDNLDIILNKTNISESNDNTRLLYGLIHARFLLTIWGLEKMYNRYKNRRFGVCPRYYCELCPVLPIGLSDFHGNFAVKHFCPKCSEVYQSGTEIDGAYFGTTFPHMLMQSYPIIIPDPESVVKFVPRIFGFKVHHTSNQVCKTLHNEERQGKR
jgi:casein kinase II subunit beta